VVHLDLSDSEFGQDGVQALCRVVSGSPQLRALQVGGCPIGSVGALCLLTATSAPTCELVALDLASTGIGKAAAASERGGGSELGAGSVLSAVAASGGHLKRINFFDNAIGAQHASTLFAALNARYSRGDPVEALGLGRTSIGDEGCFLAESFVANGSLKLLDLTSCGITDAGLVALSRAIASPTCALRELNLAGNCRTAPEGQSSLPGQVGGASLGAALASKVCKALTQFLRDTASDDPSQLNPAELSRVAKQALPQLVEMEGDETQVTDSMLEARMAASQAVSVVLGDSFAAETLPARWVDVFGSVDKARAMLHSVVVSALGAAGVSVHPHNGEVGGSPASSTSSVETQIIDADVIEAVSVAHRASTSTPVAAVVVSPSSWEDAVSKLTERVIAAEARAEEAETRAGVAEMMAREAVAAVQVMQTNVATLLESSGTLRAAVEGTQRTVTTLNSEWSVFCAGFRDVASLEEEEQQQTLFPVSDEEETVLVDTPAGIAASLRQVLARHQGVQGAGDETELKEDLNALRTRLISLEDAVMREQAETIAVLERIIAAQSKG
jgi:hypothetical protein